MLETDMNKLCECNRQPNPIANTDVKITFDDAPFIQYERFRLNDNFQQYLKTIMISEKILRMGIQKKAVSKAL